MHVGIGNYGLQPKMLELIAKLQMRVVIDCVGSGMDITALKITRYSSDDYTSSGSITTYGVQQHGCQP